MSDKRILVVEDEPSLAEVVSLYLKRAGFQVQVAADGKQAMNILEKQIPDFVILDLMLPEVDGLSLTRWLRDRSDVPIIMVTAKAKDEDVNWAIKTGAKAYLVKPFKPDVLLDYVRRYARKPAAA